MNTLPIEDMSKAYLEHSMVIHNFIIKIGSQIKDSLCRVFGDSVQYQWRENDDKVVIPDVSIICNMRDRKNVSFTGIPRFVMEVLSDSTEFYDRNEKMQIYCKVGVSEYWIVDWRKNRLKFICLIGKRMIHLTHIFTKQSPRTTKMNFRLLCFLTLKSHLMNYLISNKHQSFYHQRGCYYLLHIIHYNAFIRPNKPLNPFT